LVRRKGGPNKATTDEVLTFFSDFRLKASSVHLRFKERRGAGEVRSPNPRSTAPRVARSRWARRSNPPHPTGVMTTQALILFPSLEEAQRALSLDKEFFSPRFRQRYVRVLLAADWSPADLVALVGATLQAPARPLALAAPAAAQAPAMDVVKLRGLPIHATSTDVVAFFSGYKMRAGGVHLQHVSGNCHSKVAYVEFANAREADRAMVRSSA
jgi:hypothetical protein